MFDVIESTLATMARGPQRFARALEFAVEGLGSQVTQDQLLKHLKEVGPGDDGLGLLRRKLAKWDNEDAEWASETEKNSDDRRLRIYELMELDEPWQKLCDERLPVQKLDRPTVIATEHAVWYTPEIRRGRDYYWSCYRDQLAKNGWAEDSLIQLDDSTNSIVERLADPTDEKAWQSKGLVIGYVQSGKTANFTGVVAKAADAGYRLIIVLGGMLDVLRSQTQRRLDKELVGKELLQREYINDPDWDDFLSHGAKPSEKGAFDFSRLTGPEADYKSLIYALEALKFEPHVSSEPFFHSDNLYRAPARIAVLKKNSKIIQRLLTDLSKVARGKIGAPLDQVPTLIIDDESDQASINTKSPSGGGIVRDRTQTNEAIISLLRMLPRSQYIGYTATPFANVFVDPSSEDDIFPKDFLISLPRPVGYMGVSDFYDLNAGPDDPKPNKADFVRGVRDKDEKPENLQRAVDSYVLSGAIKRWRAARNSKLKFRNHTMLIHLSEKQSDHKAMAKLVRATYAAAGYDAGKGLDRLVKLFQDDFRPVYERRGGDLEFPESFEELAIHLGECLTEIGEAAEAVLIVNNEHKEQTPDFDQQSVWKILVGGTKLSRGYTVEGLTTSYYRRRTGAGDTLMQMGRWFGFRRGYNDLVRLFIGTNEPVGRSGRTIDLYEAFGGVCRDEEAFRKELERYASMEERVLPVNVPPLVPQHMLRPTAANKMRNAVLEFRNFGGQLSESTYAPTDEAFIRANNAALSELLAEKTITERELVGVVRGAKRAQAALTAGFSTAELIKFLRAYKWYDPGSKESWRGNPLHLQIEFLEKKGGDHEIEDWILLAPRIGKPRTTTIIHEASFDVVHRSRHTEQPWRFHTYNDPAHRQYAEHISNQADVKGANAELNALRKPHRGVLIYYPVTEQKTGPAKEPFTVACTLLFPPNNIRSQLGFTVRRPDKPGDAVVSTGD
ncbi:MAG: Z1 domain-containing protein [Sphingosinicella sp.]|uniref:Z1 domain-containing protein n=1 Tax=Sphingosinicella sp. TaxID=1917971 RepID=UPI00403844D3